MLDELFFKKKMDLRPVNFAFFGFCVTLIGIFTAIMLFGLDSSIAQILFVTILLMPPVMKLFQEAEYREKRSGTKNLYKNHKDVLKIFSLMFLGVFAAYLLVQLTTIHNIEWFRQMFDYQVDFLLMNEHFTTGLMDAIAAQTGNLGAILSDLLFLAIGLVVAGFVLSIFYGSGGVFLIVLSASVFSTLFIFLMQMFEFFAHYSAAFILMFLCLFLPLMIGFILSATAGGVISKAIVSENIKSRSFNKVLKDALILLCISIGVIVAGLALSITLFWLVF